MNLDFNKAYYLLSCQHCLLCKVYSFQRPKFCPLLPILSYVLDTALTIPVIVYVCTYGEMSLSEGRVRVGCSEINPQEFFMLVTNVFIGL